MEVQHKLNDQDIHRKSFHHHLKEVKAEVTSNTLTSKDNLINTAQNQTGTLTGLISMRKRLFLFSSITFN